MPIRLTSQRANVVVGGLLALVLIGLLLGKIARWRESADAMSCQNNLKQLGLALQSYHDANDKLPPLVDVGEGSRSGRGLYSVFSLLLPYAESSPFWFRPDDPASAYHAHSSVVARAGISDKNDGVFDQYGGVVNRWWGFFLDPADPPEKGRLDIPVTLPDRNVGYYATGSYTVNSFLPWGMGKLSADTIGKVVFSERPQVCVTANGEEVFNLWGVGFQNPNQAVFTPVPATDPGAPFQWIRAEIACDPTRPGTPHRNGLQAGMADGSVRVFAHGTDAAIWWAACKPE